MPIVTPEITPAKRMATEAMLGLAGFLALHLYAIESQSAQVEARAAAPAVAPEPPGMQDIPVVKLRPRHAPETASRSLRRPPLPTATALHAAPVETGRYWFGYQGYFEQLGPTERHNAYVLYVVGKALGKTTIEIGCTDNIAYRESGVQVHNPNSQSEADGIPQANPASKMASAGPDWQTNPYTQTRWMYGYVDERYGGACNAWDFWQHNMYY